MSSAATIAAVGAVAGAAVSASMAPDGSNAASLADPFAGQRGQYQTQLQQLMQGGSATMANDPSYQWRLKQGEQALARNTAASGNLMSGNRLTAITDYAQNQASTEYQNQYNRLAQLSGATSGSPAAAGQIASQENMNQQASASALGNTVGNVVSGWGTQLYNNYGSGGSSGAGSGTNMSGFYTPSTAFSGGSGLSDYTGMGWGSLKF